MLPEVNKAETQQRQYPCVSSGAGPVRYVSLRAEHMVEYVKTSSIPPLTYLILFSWKRRKPERLSDGALQQIYGNQDWIYLFAIPRKQNDCKNTSASAPLGPAAGLLSGMKKTIPGLITVKSRLPRRDCALSASDFKGHFSPCGEC